MAIKFPSALDVLPKKEAKVSENTGLYQVERKFTAELPKNEAVIKNCAATFDDVVRNTVELFRAYGRV